MEKLWSKYYVVMLLVSFLMFFAHYMLVTTQADYTIKIGGSPAIAGIVGGLFTIMALVARMAFGVVLDRAGRWIVIIIGSAVVLAVSVLYPLAAVVPMFLLFRMINGAGFSAFTTSANTIIADLVPESRLAEGISYFGVAGTLATALGPVIGLYLAGINFNWMFILVMVLSAGAFGLALTLRYEKHRPVVKRQKGRIKILEKSALPSAVVTLLLSLPLDAIMIFIAAYGQDRGMKYASLFFPVHAVAMMLARITLGRLADRIGPTKIFVATMVLGILSFVLLAFARSDLLMIVASFIFGIPMGMSFTVLNSIMIRLCPKDSLGAGSATLFAFEDIGFGLGAIIMGFVIQFVSFTAFFLLAATLFTASVLAYLVLVAPRVRNMHIKPIEPVNLVE